MELIAAGSYSSIRSLFSSSESVSVATSCSSSLTSASGLRSSLYYKTIQTEMASSLDPLSCDASEPDAITFTSSSIVNQPSSLTPQSSIVSHSSVVSPPSSLSHQSSIVSHFSVVSPPSSLSHQSSIACQSSVSPSSSYSRQSAIVSQFSGDSSSSSRSPVSTACQPNQPTAFSFPKRKFGEARPVFGLFRRLGSRNGHGFTMTRSTIKRFVLHV